MDKCGDDDMNCDPAQNNSYYVSNKDEISYDPHRNPMLHELFGKNKEYVMYNKENKTFEHTHSIR